jgi:Holliday junction resolvase RusA-like endonuclease
MRADSMTHADNAGLGLLCPMTGSLSFFVPGEPRSKERPRTVRVKKSGKTITYTPTATTSYEHTVRTHARRAIALARWGPSSKDDRFNVSMEVRLGTRRRKDLDNIVKAVLDGLMPVVFADDWQVCSFYVHRVVGHPKPGLELRIDRVFEKVDGEA